MDVKERLEAINGLEEDMRVVASALVVVRMAAGGEHSLQSPYWKTGNVHHVRDGPLARKSSSPESQFKPQKKTLIGCNSLHTSLRWSAFQSATQRRHGLMMYSSTLGAICQQAIQLLLHMHASCLEQEANPLLPRMHSIVTAVVCPRDAGLQNHGVRQPLRGSEGA